MRVLHSAAVKLILKLFHSIIVSLDIPALNLPLAVTSSYPLPAFFSLLLLYLSLSPFSLRTLFRLPHPLFFFSFAVARSVICNLFVDLSFSCLLPRAVMLTRPTLHGELIISRLNLSSHIFVSI